MGECRVCLAVKFAVASDSVQSLWNTHAGGSGTAATPAASGAGTYYTAQSASNLFDGKLTSSFASRGNSVSGSNAIAGLNTGFHVTIAQCHPTLVSFRLGTGTSGTERDPMNITVEGSNGCSNLLTCGSWMKIYEGSSGLENTLSRSTFGMNVSIPTPASYASYRFLVTAKRNSGIYVTYTEVELYGY